MHFTAIWEAPEFSRETELTQLPHPVILWLQRLAENTIDEAAGKKKG